MKKLLMAIIMASALEAAAKEYVIPPDSNVIGQVEIVNAEGGESYSEIGIKYGIGHDNIVNANRDRIGNKDLDSLLLKKGDQVVLPNRFILPDAPREGIVINLAEMRLYYYPPGKNVVDVYAIGIGRDNWRPPLGQFTIKEKTANPTWRPPASIRKEHAEQGDPLPAVVPSGPDNPLGLFAMRLSNPSYLIHGTNKPEGVGMDVSHGCIRMYPAGIAELFKKVSPNTKVNIINQSTKVGWYGDDLYLEFHKPVEESERRAKSSSLEEDIANARAAVQRALAGRNVDVSDDAIAQVVREESGIPSPLTQVASNDAPNAPANGGPRGPRGPVPPLNNGPAAPDMPIDALPDVIAPEEGSGELNLESAPDSVSMN